MQRSDRKIYDEIGVPSRRYHNKISALTAPMRIHLGIDQFWRNSHSTDGSYSLIGNHPPTAGLFFDQHLFLGHPLFRHPMFIQSGYILPELLHSRDYESTQGQLRVDGGCYHVCIKIHKTAHGIVEYGFACSKFQPGFEVAYMKQLQNLDKFIAYFDREADKIIRLTEDFKIDISKLIGTAYHENPQFQAPIAKQESEFQFLIAMENDLHRSRALLALTNTERSILRLVVLGKTAREIGAMLFRSHRTIENHLETIKEKLAVNGRSGLVEALLPYKDCL